jgi:hypothetical protein
MQEQCDSKQLHFQGLGPRKVVGDFEGGTLTSDAGGLLLREVDRAYGMVDEFSECFVDYRAPDAIEHPLRQLVAQRVFGICLGYEDLNDHEQLRYDPVLAVICGQADVEGKRRERAEDQGKALAGKSTLQRFEASNPNANPKSRYKKITYEQEKCRGFFVNHFLKSYNGGQEPEQIVLDIDATDDPLHGRQEERFFHGFHNCYCYLPLYIFCDSHFLAGKLRPSNTDASAGADVELARVVGQIRERWPKVRIIVRGDSGFCREWLMSWCEANKVDYLFGIARNSRLRDEIETQMERARRRHAKSGKAAQIFRSFQYRTLDSWSRSRRVIGKAEYLDRGENPRFIVTSLKASQWSATRLYKQLYCARGDMENRIKEQQLYLFSDRTSCATMRANQLRLWFSAVAYLLMNELRLLGLVGTELESAQCHTIRLKLLKIGARVTVSVRRVVIHMAGGYPYHALFRTSLCRIQMAFP